MKVWLRPSNIVCPTHVRSLVCNWTCSQIWGNLLKRCSSTWCYKEGKRSFQLPFATGKGSGGTFHPFSLVMWKPNPPSGRWKGNRKIHLSPSWPCFMKLSKQMHLKVCFLWRSDCELVTHPWPNTSWFYFVVTPWFGHMNWLSGKEGKWGM